jgi:hypothetical protein
MSKPATDKPLINTILDRLSHYVHAGALNNDDMVQIIELMGDYLNLATRAQWARRTGKSYNGGKKFRRNIRLFGANFIIDND